MPLYHSAAGMLGAGCMVTTGVTLVLTRKFSASTFFKTCTFVLFLSLSSHDLFCFVFIIIIITNTQTGTQFGVTDSIHRRARAIFHQFVPSVWDKRNRVRIAMVMDFVVRFGSDFVNRFGIPEIGEFYGSTEGNVIFLNHWIKRDHMNDVIVGSVGRMGALLKKMVGFRLLEHDVTTEMPCVTPELDFVEKYLWDRAVSWSV